MPSKNRSLPVFYPLFSHVFPCASRSWLGCATSSVCCALEPKAWKSPRLPAQLGWPQLGPIFEGSKQPCVVSWYFGDYFVCDTKCVSITSMWYIKWYVILNHSLNGYFIKRNTDWKQQTCSFQCDESRQESTHCLSGTNKGTNLCFAREQPSFYAEADTILDIWYKGIRENMSQI